MMTLHETFQAFQDKKAIKFNNGYYDAYCTIFEMDAFRGNKPGQKMQLSVKIQLIDTRAIMEIDSLHELQLPE